MRDKETTLMTEPSEQTIRKKVIKLASQIRPHTRKKWAMLAGVIGCAAIVIIPLTTRFTGPDKVAEKIAAYEVKRGQFTVKITESGDIKSLNSTDIKSRVEGRSTIISIVEEGTYIRPEDVNKMVLVELDSSLIRQKLTQQQVYFLSAEASFAEAKESLEIQKKQNESDIKGGEMNVKFAIMDLQKYIGAQLAEKFTSATPLILDANMISKLMDDPQLGGEALQKQRELKAAIDISNQEYKQAETKLQWTQKLFDHNYASLSELDQDRLSKNSKDIARSKSSTARELFIQYEFPKEVEKRIADYQESLRELDRIMASSRAKLAQAQSRLESTKATYEVQKEQLEKLRTQLAACIIKAPAPGQVVYGTSSERYGRQPLEAGSDIHERQKIISIPDPCGMKVEIKIHETWVDKVHIGQKAMISIPAFSDLKFSGKVIRKSPLADQSSWWLNPDLKVYATDVSIDGTHNFLKTGMTAKVEIVIEQSDNVLSVPLQSVINQDGKKVCYVLTSKGPVKREVQTDSFNENSVVIKSGLKEGERVLLNPPRSEAST